jgi:hypothetical protein
VSCNGHHGLVAGLGLSKLRDRVVAKIVETESISRTLNFASVGFALTVLASFAWVLLQATLRAPDRRIGEPAGQHYSDSAIVIELFAVRGGRLSLLAGSRIPTNYLAKFKCNLGQGQ